MIGELRSGRIALPSEPLVSRQFVKTQPKTWLRLPRSAWSARSRRGYSAPWCGYSCGGGTPGFHAARSRTLNAVAKRRPRIFRKHKLRSRKRNPSWGQNPPSFKETRKSRGLRERRQVILSTSLPKFATLSHYYPRLEDGVAPGFSRSPWSPELSRHLSAYSDRADPRLLDALRL